MDMIPTKTFRLTKRNKTMVALLKFRNDDSRHEFKHMMIQAQLASEVRLKAEPRKSPGMPQSYDGGTL